MLGEVASVCTNCNSTASTNVHHSVDTAAKQQLSEAAVMTCSCEVASIEGMTAELQRSQP